MIVHLDYVEDLISRKDKIKELGIGPGVLEIRNSVDDERIELTDKDVALLTTALQSNTVLNTLKLVDCVPSELNGSLATLIAKCKIRTITFDCLELNNSIQTEIAEGLKSNSSLENITFDNVNFAAGESLNTLIEGLESNRSINSVMFRRTNLPKNVIDQLINSANSQAPLRWSHFYIVNNNPELDQAQQAGIPANNKRLRY